MIKYKIKNTDLVEFKKKRVARMAVTKAIRTGDLIRACSCQLCNETCKTNAHHIDYGKPLEVMWLCDHCHGVAHRSDSDLNPKNNEQTWTPSVWYSGDMVTVSFQIPVEQFMILKDQARNSNKKISSILRNNLIKDYPIESSQLEFQFEGKNGETNHEHNQDIQSLGKDEVKMLQPKLSPISTIRREGDKGLRGMDTQPKDFYFGYGANAGQLQCAYSH